MTLATRIAVMDRGLIRQIGTATEVYEYPKSKFVAGFIGSINMFEGEVEEHANGLASIAAARLGGVIKAKAEAKYSAGQRVAVAVRPEKIALTREQPAGAANAFHGVVQDLGYFGKDSLYRIKMATGEIVSVNSVNARRAGENERVAQWEDEVWLSFDPSAAILLED